MAAVIISPPAKQPDRDVARQSRASRICVRPFFALGIILALLVNGGLFIARSGQVAASTSTLSTNWNITVYYTAVESFHTGAPTVVKGCLTINCSRGNTDLGTYPNDFVQAVKDEGTGRITSGSRAGGYLNWSYDTGYWFDTAPRNAYGEALIPYVSAAADNLARGTTFAVVDCGKDSATGSLIDGSVCQRLKSATWRIADEFTPGYGGEQHTDLYIGEEDSFDFLSTSPKVIATAGAILDIGGSHPIAPSPTPSGAPTPSSSPQGPTTANTHTLTIVQRGQGSVSPGTTIYPAGATVTLKAQSASNWVFSHWMIDGNSTRVGLSLTISMDRDHTVAASFVERISYGDVPPDHPAAKAIAQLSAAGIVRGYQDGGFGPDDTTLRAQIAALIVRAAGWEGEDWGNPFSDRGEIDANLWRSVGTLAHYGVARGYGDGTYQPTADVSHAQVISLITRTMVAKGEWQLRPDDGIVYPNIPVTSSHRQDIATYVSYAGALPDTTPTAAFAGWERPANRAWVARALWAALDR
jgi:hypothetical protein